MYCPLVPQILKMFPQQPIFTGGDPCQDGLTQPPVINRSQSRLHNKNLIRMNTNTLRRLNSCVRFAHRASRTAMLMLCFAIAFGAQGASLTWDADTGTTGAQDGSGTWTTGAGGWWNGSANVNFAASDIPTFGAGTDGTYAITVGGAITCGTPLTFNNSGYTFSAASTEVITFASVVTIAAGKTATIGNNVQLTRPGTWTLNGPGTLNVSGPGSVFGNASGSGSTIGTGATINVTNGGSLLCGSSLSMSGISGGANLNVNGGSVSVAAGNVSLILNTSGSGSVNVTLTNGGTISIGSITGGGLRFGSGATTGYGVFNLDGGTLTTSKVFENTGAAILSTNNFNGGILKAASGTTAGTILMTGLDRANVRNGGAIFDPNGTSVIISQPLVHSGISGDNSIDGGVTVVGTGGTVSLTGTNTYTGPTTINGSTLGIIAPYNSITASAINNGGRLKVTSNTNSSVLPSITLNNGGGIQFDLGAYTPANVPGITNANIIVSGTNVIDIAGSSIPVTTITLLAYTNKTGTSTFVLGTLPAGLAANLVDTGSNLVLNVTSPSGNSYVWSAGSGDWNFTNPNWNAGASIYSEVQPALVSFPAIAVGAVNIPSNVNPYSITVDGTSAGYTFGGAGSISGATTFSKSGASYITLTSSNSYTGLTSISAGSIVATANSALGGTAGATTVASGAALALSGGVNYSQAEPLTIAGPGVGTSHFFVGSATQRGALQGISGDNIWAGNITLNPDNNNRIGVQDGAQLTLTGNITQSTNGLNLVFRAGNTAGSDITISGSGNNWSGSTSIYGGGGAAVHLGAANTLPSAAFLAVGILGIGGDCIFDLNGFNQQVAGLTGDPVGIVLNNGGQTATLTLNLSTNNQTYSGVIQDGANSVAIVKNGTYTQVFSNAFTYSGPTTINGGSLRLVGSLGTTPITVNTNGTLDGTGTIGGPVIINAGGALITGGGSVGTLTINNNLTIAGNLLFKVDKSLAQSNDLVNVSGVLTNAGTGTLTVTNIGTNTLAMGDSFNLFSQAVSNGLSLTINGPAGVTFTNNLQVDGSIAVLSVQGATATYPTNISFSVTGSTLSLTWPATHLGWYAQSNSVNLANTNYWFDVLNSQNGTNLNITISPEQTNVFYRLRHP